MLKFVQHTSKYTKITGISMGELGSCTRILGPIVGNTLNYASLSNAETTAPGQLSVHDLNALYHIRKLNLESKIYALLGDPVDKSAGHIFHNQAIQLLKQNAVYIKLKVKPEELEETVKYCKDLPFAGFSITMPLKESIVNLLDHIDISAQKIKAINTIVINNSKSKWTAYNTDGLGAINSILDITPTLSDKTVAILGAGGAARAIAYEAIEHGGKVIILNRTLDKAKKLSADLGCEFIGLEDITQIKSLHYDIIINTLPTGILPPDELPFIPNKIAMDIVYNPINIPFLDKARKANCICIPGYEMFNRQALLQIQHWFQPSLQELENIKKLFII
jgi:3-dehydroquinate dehydratase/shikimate dehydrogenase